MAIGIGAKVALGVVGISTVAGGGLIANQLFSGTQISELLKKDDFVLLSKSDENNAQWGKRWQEYVKQGNKWALSSFQANESKKDDAPEDFKNACIQKASSKVKDNKDSTYTEIATLCTKSFAISELIKKDNNIELVSGKTAKSGANKWKDLWENYYDNAKTENPLGLALSNPQKGTIPNDYETRCVAKEKEEIKNNKDQNYEIVKKWCTEAKAK